MQQKIIKRGILTLLWLGVLALILINGVVLWVATGPRSISYLTPYVVKALTPEDGSLIVEVEETLVTWNSWKDPIDIKVQEVIIKSPKGDTFARFPEISVELSKLPLLSGTFKASSIEIDQPQVLLIRHEDGSIGLGFVSDADTALTQKAAEQEVSLERIIAGLMDAQELGSDIEHIGLTRADVMLLDETGETILFAPDTKIVLNKDEDGVTGFGEFAIQHQQNLTNLTLRFHVDQASHQLVARLDVNNFFPSMLREFISQIPTLDALEALPISGAINIYADPKGNISLVEYGVEVGEGVVDLPEYFERPLTFESITAQGKLRENFTKGEVEELNFDLGEITGSIAAKWQPGEKSTLISGVASAQGMQVNDLKYYWPKTLAPNTRGWVTSNIREGMVKATTTFDFKDGDLLEPVTPEHAVDANIEVTDTSVVFLPNHPPAKQVNGLIHITGKTLDTKLPTASFLKKAKLTDVMFHIVDLNSDILDVTVEFGLKTPAATVVELMELPALGQAKALGLSKSKASGDISADVNIAFETSTDFSKPSEDGKPDEIDASKVHATVNAKLNKVSHKGVMGDTDIENVTGDLKIEDTYLRYKGDVTINTAPLKVEITHFLKGKDKTVFTAKGTIPTDKLAGLGIDGLPPMTGSIDIDSKRNTQSGKSTTKADVNFTNASVSIPKMGFDKPLGQPASLSLDITENKTGLVNVNRFNLKTHAAKASGSLVFDKSAEQLISLSADNISMAGSQASVNLKTVNGQMQIDARGKTLNLTPFLEAESDEASEPFTFSSIPAIQLAAAFDQIKLANNEQLQNATILIQCGEVICENVDVKAALTKGQPLAFSIERKGGIRHLSSAIEDAGAFIRALDIVDNVIGGKLLISGKFDDSNPKHPLEGRLLMLEYKLQKAPILTRILTLASLTGVVELLSGQGIGFDKMAIPFVLQEDIVYIKDGKSFGSSIGLTFNGNINLKKEALDLEGAVVPSYTLNSFFQKIPIIGILAGSEGEGLIAGNYAIKGDMSDPSVSVNPLSILTPGFLRNLFDITGTPATAPEEGLKPKQFEPKTQSHDPRLRRQ